MVCVLTDFNMSISLPSKLYPTHLSNPSMHPWFFFFIIIYFPTNTLSIVLGWFFCIGFIRNRLEIFYQTQFCMLHFVRVNSLIQDPPLQLCYCYRYSEHWTLKVTWAILCGLWGTDFSVCLLQMGIFVDLLPFLEWPHGVNLHAQKPAPCS